jgi:hypothetical protein
MVSVYREFESRSSERILNWYLLLVSLLSTQHSVVRDTTNWDGIRIMCPKRATCLPAEFPFGELAL